ncbi:hypothetical protein M8C21_024475 [Ambrosia artemisiifolia]|uniref:Ubiquitin-like protease family profile domain-containing protein n=1 Tax=Ambrosia artemisiifolia TaxID=4212 RepID=A0AAD5GJI5_AMBAR|nr:hypothetical protein M8C21_024475 [Ambrosia artemisiifolia]
MATKSTNIVDEDKRFGQKYKRESSISVHRVFPKKKLGFFSYFVNCNGREPITIIIIGKCKGCCSEKVGCNAGMIWFRNDDPDDDFVDTTKKIIRPFVNEDPDDDFLDPPPKVARFTKNMVARLPLAKTEVNTKTQKQKAPSTTVVKLPTRPYAEYTGAKIVLRSPPSHLPSIPPKMGYWLVQNYNPDTCVLNLGSHQIHITQELPALAHDQQVVDMSDHPNTHLIQWIDDAVLDGLVTPLDSLLFKQQLESENGISDKVRDPKPKEDLSKDSVVDDAAGMCQTADTLQNAGASGNEEMGVEDWGNIVEDDDDNLGLGPFRHCKEYFSQEDSQAIRPYVGDDGEYIIPVVLALECTQGQENTWGEPDTELLQDPDINIAADDDFNKNEGVEVFDVKPLSWSDGRGETRCEEAKKLQAKTPRPGRVKQLPEAMRSPYVKRIVGLHERLEKSEEVVSNYMFSAWDSKWDDVFTAVLGCTVMRSFMESLRPDISLNVNVISAWSNVLNYEERYRRKGTSPRLFCSLLMLWKDDYDKSEEIRVIHFTENMDSVLASTETKSIKGVQFVNIPMHSSDHYYLLFFNMTTYEKIDNIDSDVEFSIRYKGWLEKMRDAFSAYLRTVSPSAAAKIKKSIPKVLNIPWKTKHNGIDCGVFLMRHMETYKGTSLKEWRFGF